MDQQFESEVMEELAEEMDFSFSDSDKFEDFDDIEKESFDNNSILDEMAGFDEFEDFDASEEQYFLDNHEFTQDFEGGLETEFADALDDQAFAQINGGNLNNNSYEFDDVDLWEVGAEALDAASAKTKQKRASIEKQRRRRQRKQQKRKSKRPKKQPLTSTTASRATSSTLTTRSPLLNQLRAEVYANLPRVVVAASDPKTKSVLRTLGAALGSTPSPTLRSLGQGLGALVNSLPADEFEAIDAMFDWAENEDAIEEAAPAIAQLTVHQLASGLPSTTKYRLLKSITQATRLLSQRQGSQAARAIPAIVQSVMRTARRRRISAKEIPPAIYRTAAQVAANPSLLNRLSISPKN